jgi:type IV pilus assembly protein PilC
MPKFFYIARNPTTGEKITGSEEAASPDELTLKLQANNLIVVNILGDTPQSQRSYLVKTRAQRRFKHARVTNDDLAVFCRQLAVLLSSGVTILKSLEIIMQQISSSKLYDILANVKSNMEQGFSFHEAVGKHPKVFSELWVNLIESGEASGSLAIVLNRLASYLERNAAFKKKIISALIYPTIILIAGTGALLFLTLKIIPTFAELFKTFNVEMPLITKILLGISAFMRHSFVFMIILAIIGFTLFKNYIRTKTGRIQYEKFKFGLPIFGDFFKAIVVERFSSEMSTLIESGVPLLYSLEISERSVNNLVMGEIIRNVKDEVRRGKSLNQPLEQSGFFPPMISQMVSIGEEIGELPQMFKRINSFYEEEVETFLARFTAMFEPIILIFMGLVVGIMVIGLFVPIFQIARLKG